MILTNRLSIFDKKGNAMNMLPESAVRVTVVDPLEAGSGAIFNVYTNREGKIAYLEIVDGGENYTYSSPNEVYLKFEDLFTNTVWNSDPGDLTVDVVTGKILGFSGLPSSNNKGFTYPAVTYRGELYFDRVSTGLVENQDVFIIENVFLDTNVAVPPAPLDLQHSFPRAEEGPQNLIQAYGNLKRGFLPGESDDGIGFVEIANYAITGNILDRDDRVFGTSTVSLSIGMIVEGLGIPTGTKITEIINATTFRMSAAATADIGGVSILAYKPHGFITGMEVRIRNIAVFDEPFYTVLKVTDTIVYFDTPKTLPQIPSTPVSGDYTVSAVPKWRGRVVGSEGEIFMFTVDYNEDFPTINKINAVLQNPINSSALTVPDLFSAGASFGAAVGNFASASVPGYQYRVVNTSSGIPEEMMRFHLGFSSDTEGVFLKLFILEDVTFPYAPSLIAQISLRGEAEGPDERLGKLLENFGREVPENLELIVRESDVYEDKPNYLVLNNKRKEMLLAGDDIWPYLGSYRGLVNMVNWFGYYDLRIKEYWLNVKEGDPGYLKYKQIQIPFQLRDKTGVNRELQMVPSRIYKKTNKFGLFYDITRDSGELDVDGVPLTEDAFQFSNEEVLIKLFALKKYLQENFLPVNTRIIDIVGEGVYYEKYAGNVWNDRVEQFVVEATRRLDFRATRRRVRIVRDYTSRL
jgi:hypothetical protein